MKQPSRTDRRIPEAAGVRRLFQEQWDYLMKLIDRRQAQSDRLRQDRATEQQAVEEVVDGTNTRVRVISGYNKRLRNSVQILLQYIADITTRLPPSIDANPQYFSENPQLNAFFINPQHITETFGNSREIRAYFAAAHAGAATVHSVMFMRKKEKSTLGVGLVDDKMVRDLPRTTISFTDHQFKDPGATEADARSVLKKHLFDCFVSYVKLQMIQIATEANKENQEAVVPATDLNNPENYLTHLCKTLENPQILLQLESNLIRINRMGVKIEDNSKEPASELVLHEIKLGLTTKDVIVLVTFPRAAMPEEECFFEQADSLLSPMR